MRKKNSIGFLIGHCNVTKKFLLISMVVVGVESLSSVGLIYFEGKAIDIIAGTDYVVEEIITVFLTVLGFIFLQWIWSVVVPYMFKKHAIAQGAKIRDRFQTSLVNASMTDVSRLGKGDIAMKSSVEIGRVQKFLADDFYIVLKRLMMGCGAVVLSAIFDWRLALLEFASVPFIVKKNMDCEEKLDENFYMIDAYYGQMSDLFTNVLCSMKLIKSYCAELFFENKISNLLNDVQAESIRNNKKIVDVMNRLIGLNLIPMFIHYFAGTFFILSDWITLGEFVAFASLRGCVTNFLMYIPTFIPKAKAAIASIRRIEEVTQLDEETELIECTDMHEHIALEGQNLQFSYEGQIIFNNVNVTIFSNKINLLVGKSGIGKTTLLNVLSGIFLPNNGRVIYNNKIIKTQGQRMNIAYVGQEPFLLNSTIKENLDIMNRASMDNIVTICRKLNIHDAIMELPNQYETEIGGDAGKVLSGGQLQRLGFARAYLSEADIIFMDEPSSALDVKSEQQMLKLMKELKKEKTFVIATHSETMIPEGDYIYLLEGGNVSAIDHIDSYKERLAAIN